MKQSTIRALKRYLMMYLIWKCAENFKKKIIFVSILEAGSSGVAQDHLKLTVLCLHVQPDCFTKASPGGEACQGSGSTHLGGVYLGRL